MVTVNLIPRGTQTELVLIHGPFPTQKDRENHNRGWSSALERIPAAI